MVKLYDGTNERIAIGKGGGADSPVFTCGSGWPGNAGDDLSATPVAAGPVWLVVRIDMNGSTTEDQRTYMWINPNPAGPEPDTSTAIVKRNSTFPNGFDMIAIEFGGDGANVRLVFDEIHIATSFADLNASTPAGTVARESFNYSFTTLAGLGTASNGFGGPWVVDPSAGGVEGLVAISGSRFSYDDLSYDVAHDTVHLQVVKSNAWSDFQRYKRPLAAAWPNTAGAHYWVSYLLDVKEPLPVGNTYFMVKLYDGTNERIAIGKGGGADSPVFTCGSGWPGASGDDVSATPIEAGPVWLVARIDMNGSTTEDQRTYMWVNPNPAGPEPDTSTAIVKRNSTFPNGFDMIAIEFGGDGADVRLEFDEISISPTFAGLATAVPSEPSSVPAQFALLQNYPNPFNPSTKILYTLQATGQVRLSVYDLLGREVAVLVDAVQHAGEHQVSFQGQGLPSGVYFYRLQSGQGLITKKMVLMK